MKRLILRRSQKLIYGLIEDHNYRTTQKKLGNGTQRLTLRNYNLFCSAIRDVLYTFPLYFRNQCGPQRVTVEPRELRYRTILSSPSLDYILYQVYRDYMGDFVYIVVGKRRAAWLTIRIYLQYIPGLLDARLVSDEIWSLI